ncbi:DALR anticodon-binding domain-containing protein 3 isoform X2 [Chelonoidis abingdonii]|uniref:DALR anticodon-binding domain-containing protein 3 isoform X2 n=1 Tax=Chelonoidis abingdonii TaxID=106734 RepID=UPI0013F19F62|nr:DALR anticodon-binding domain-containing protein 3 isoform X3 [Chelonoidis abingdonii]
METGGGRFGVSETLGALNAALKKEPGPPASVWFKESSARNLRSRDFLAPQAALRPLFAGGQVPKDIIEDVMSLKRPGLPPLQSCQQTPLGLTVQLQRPAAFQQALNSIAELTKPFQSTSGQSIILNCTPLWSQRSLAMLSLSHLRAILVTDHLAEVLRIQGLNVHLVPAVPDEGIQKFLHQLRVDWPSELETTFIPEDVLALKQVLSQCPYAIVPGLEPGQTRLADDVIFKVHLKNFLVQQSLEGYDPNLDVCLVTEEKLQVLAELRQMALRCAGTGPGGCCRVVHVVSCEGEFQQQQVDLLWRMLDLGAHTALQEELMVKGDLISLKTFLFLRCSLLLSFWSSTTDEKGSVPASEDLDAKKHLVCGPVKVANSPSPVGAPQYFQLRRCQMYEASVMKYGDLVQDDSWTEIISVLTSAAMRFEMLSTAHQSQIFLDLEDSSISTKGTKSGAFVMYNCARLATLFKSYEQAVEQGAYPAFPPASELNFSLLREEGEWLLLFNYILPFPETLSQAAQLPLSSKGIRITASTEAEPLPHLFSQMFARLQLMRGVRDVIHRALATLHLPPLSQI